MPLLPSTGVRLQKFLASAGIASRRQAELLISGSRISVNGAVITELGTRVDPVSDSVEVDGVRVRQQEPVYLIMNKPKGTVCTERDPDGRPRVIDLLPKGLPRAFSIGRLDWDTEGLLLFTNDGELAKALLDPQRHVPRIYRVKIQGPVDQHLLRRFNEGVRLPDGYRTKPSPIEVVSRTDTNAWYEVVLSEGKNRQIHRMVEACGHRVLKLVRLSYGPVQLGTLPLGRCRILTDGEVDALESAAGVRRERIAQAIVAAKREAEGRRKPAASAKAAVSKATPARKSPPGKAGAAGKAPMVRATAAKVAASRAAPSLAANSPWAKAAPASIRPKDGSGLPARPVPPKKSAGAAFIESLSYDDDDDDDDDDDYTDGTGRSHPDLDRDDRKPSHAKPGASKPSVSRPSASKPDVSRPSASKPGVSRPSASKPGTGGPTTRRSGDRAADTGDRSEAEPARKRSYGDRNRDPSDDTRPKPARTGPKSKSSKAPGFAPARNDEGPTERRIGARARYTEDKVKPAGRGKPAAGGAGRGKPAPVGREKPAPVGRGKPAPSGRSSRGSTPSPKSPGSRGGSKPRGKR